MHAIKIYRRLFLCAIAAVFALRSCTIHAQTAKHVAPLVIISLDGLRADAITHADEHHLSIPVLRSFVTGGVYAEGVRGVVPTLTYPSHTTIVTGVWPAQHGVYANTFFDPLHSGPSRHYQDARTIRVKTLYQAAHEAGLVTASVRWPVTAGATIDYNAAEFTPHIGDTGNFAPAPLHPLDLLDQIHMTNSDEMKTEMAIRILKKYKPSLLLVHIADLDDEEHGHGPFSPEANAALEVFDREVGAIMEAALAVDPETRIAVVSDHGFLPVEHHVNLNVLLEKAGMIEIDKASQHPVIRSWRAQAWSLGGSCAIILRDPKDQATLSQVRALLQQARQDPGNGISEVLEHDELVRRGGNPDASFLVDANSGFDFADALTGTVVVDTPTVGDHGYLPTHTELNSVFLMKGVGVAVGRNLHLIDMRQIAPSFAQMLGVTLPDATLSPVNYKP